MANSPINKVQPMRETEQDIADYLNNTVAPYMIQETQERKDEDTSITNHLEAAEEELEEKITNLAKQPVAFEFTDVIDGVTIQVANYMRIGGIIVYTLHITVSEGTNLEPNTKLATVPTCIGGGSVGIGSLISSNNNMISFTATTAQLTNNIGIIGNYDCLVTFVNQYID